MPAWAVGPLVLILCALIGIFIGSASYTAYYGEGASYLSNDPRSCVNCHIMREQYDSWQKASHHAFAVCNDCHSPDDFLGKWLTKAENGFRHSKGFTLQDFHEPIMIRPKNFEILNRSCLKCHDALTNEIRHTSELGFMNCVRCHRNVGHGATK